MSKSNPEPMTNLLRGLSLAALLMAGSCAAPIETPISTFEDGAANNPITVQPSYEAIKLPYGGGGLAADDAARLSAFVSDYRVRGNGSIIVSAPAGYAANEEIAYFADHINEMGVSRDHIIVTTHDAAPGDTQVDLNYVSYTASTNECGKWDEDLDKTLDNSTPRNFGCAVQQNIAAVVSDPRDLLGPRPMDDSDGRRRDTVMGNYEQGKITSSDKRKNDLGDEQSGTSSQVGK